MKNLKNLFILLLVLLTNNVFAETTNNSTKSTAQLVSSCQIQSQNISFGSLILPITSQQATSNLSVLCNRSATYVISMLQTNNIWIVVPNGASSLSYAWNTNTNSRVSLSSTSCGALSAGSCISTYGYTDAGTNSSLGLSSAVCSYPPGCQIYKNGSGNNGSMKGASKGDIVAYLIEHPTNPSKTWNTINTYTDVGTGLFQNVSVKAVLVPSGGSAYPTPDLYSDTVTTQISF